MKLPTEKVVRVVSSMIAPVEISWVQMDIGFDNLYLNFNFVLVDEHGELHAPKDQAKHSRSMHATAGGSLSLSQHALIV